MYNNLNLLNDTNKQIVHIDIDIIIERDIHPLVDLNYDFIISTEIGGNNAFPKNCSQVLGFGICSGFYIIKPRAKLFLDKILKIMIGKKFGSYSNQETIMNYITANNYVVNYETMFIGDREYINKIILIDDIKICVLDFNLIIRDSIIENGQFGNHINIDNVGGTQNFLKYFDEKLENLPLTCRCGKTHLGDYTKCIHIEQRKNKLL
jgi:hypothetical protein